jgi:hypothetical protein
MAETIRATNRTWRRAQIGRWQKEKTDAQRAKA